MNTRKTGARAAQIPCVPLLSGGAEKRALCASANATDYIQPGFLKWARVEVKLK